MPCEYSNRQQTRVNVHKPHHLVLAVLTPKKIHYDLRFEPDLKRSTFSASATIKVTLPSPTNTITLDSAELAIKRCTLRYPGGKMTARTRLNPKSEELAILLSRKVGGRVQISLDFEGTLNDRLLGFYSSAYKSGKKEGKIATTQFEAADARRAFPCWDEPAAKATFDVTLVVPRGMRAISNMPITSTKRVGQKQVCKFVRTPPMSTYLLYLGVGDFESVSTTYRKVKINVLATPGNAKHGKFALGLAKKLLSEYERYFGIRYPLPKLDLLAIPDFAAGAMENWGAITFRESLLLYDPQRSSTRTKQLIAEVVSHEIAHQWFGNLVTMKWWNDLWLNESFATFMATKFVEKLYPGWAMWDQFAEGTVNTALRLDSLKSTHPIDVDVKSPAQIREIFDAISYDKGGSVLQMLERIVGEPAFKRGLRSYLKKYAYENAEGSDLWRHIGQSAKRNLGPLVNSWIRQSGYPLLKTSANKRTLRLVQSRFYLVRPKNYPIQKWMIPLFLEGNKGPKKIISTLTSSIANTNPDGVINPSRSAFMRVMYTPEHLDALRRQTSAGKIQGIDAWMIQDDLFAFCRAQMTSVRSYLDFADVCSDQNYLVSSGVARNLRFLHRLSVGRSFEWRLRERVREHHGRMHARLGWSVKPKELHIDSMLRGEVIAALGIGVGESSIIKEAQSRFERFARSPSSLAADLREPVCSIAVANGGQKAWTKARSMYISASSQEAKTQFLASMCATTDPKLLARTLDFSQTSYVRSQNMHMPVVRIAANPAGADLVWPWLQKNWSKISKKVGQGNPLLSRMISAVSMSIPQASVASELESFFAKKHAPGTERTVKQSAEAIRINAGLRHMMEQELEAIN